MNEQMTDLMTDLGRARLEVHEAEEALRFAQARFSELEAEPRIVTFRSNVVDPGPDLDDPFVFSSKLHPMMNENVYVAVSEKPFVSYSGVERARAVVTDPASLQEAMNTVGFKAKPGDLVAVIGGGK